jgi:hypothetical protein
VILETRGTQFAGAYLQSLAAGPLKWIIARQAAENSNSGSSLTIANAKRSGMDRSLSQLGNGAHMSEYLYHEFRAVDRPLTHREIRELRALSTRAEITATSFVNTHEWGDFKGDPSILMEKYFDAFIYTANGCLFQFVLRLPRRALDTKDVSVCGRRRRMLLKSQSD